MVAATVQSGTERLDTACAPDFLLEGGTVAALASVHAIRATLEQAVSGKAGRLLR
ncbi:hypothetical protein ACQP2E_17405 [Actinoplanes sp. CA-015351]|uniref:hypothetical protein n=1 Tax=Actinoplanes sp. CA-015351 TaxID=3239897 RepID=UPI003D986C86